eukprot:TRINITY_DN710_c0_g1_i1.p1 TRINITY_DN710_c0_g1~~TRINITY_DN710_c0_g1_i1.p1  ORF type:complete len:104 (+),score=9.16 TRINITY_DN710_c0_g1_i1:305-616(+)
MAGKSKPAYVTVRGRWSREAFRMSYGHLKLVRGMHGWDKLKIFLPWSWVPPVKGYQTMLGFPLFLYILTHKADFDIAFTQWREQKFLPPPAWNAEQLGYLPIR